MVRRIRPAGLVSVVSTRSSTQQSWPRACPSWAEFFGKLFTVVPERDAEPVPVLAWTICSAVWKQPQSLAYWFYRINVYAALLWQTVQIAVMATVMGFTVAFLLSFPAAAQPDGQSVQACG